MADGNSPGDSMARRVMQRANGGLSRRVLADGGEVYSGPTAARALRAVGARAMTVDHTIIVDEDFDPTKPEDQALYAHERLHQMESGGTDDNTGHDAEEMAARAIERMVLQRSAKGEDFGDIMRDVRDRSGDIREVGPSDSPHVRSAQEDDGEQATQMKKAYQALVASGRTHEAIVDELARMVIEAVANQKDVRARRGQSTEFR